MSTRVVFFGYGQLALGVLRVLEEAGAEMAAIVVPHNRDGDAVQMVAGHARSTGRRLLVQPPGRSVAPFAGEVRRLAPDVIVIASYSMMLPPALFTIPPLGTVNVHGGLLPEYRGGHVLQWAILNGERGTGVTLHYVDEGIDTGPVIATDRVAIDPEDDAVAVKEKLRVAAVGTMERWWPRIADGTAPRAVQDESLAKYWPLRRPAEGRINWASSASSICRLVRALASNVPGAYVEKEGQVISIRRARVVELPAGSRRRPGEPGTPGHIVGLEVGGLRIAAADADVLVTEAVVDGRELRGMDVAHISGFFGA